MTHNFETYKDVCREADTRADMLEAYSNLAWVIEELRTCDGGEEGCELPICPVCLREHRKRSFREISEQFRNRKCSLLTVLLHSVPRGDLQHLKPSSVKQQLEKMLRRAGFSMAFGGIEIEWKPKKKRWLVHAHLVGLDIDEKAIKALRKKLKKRPEIKRPLMRQKVKDRDKQLSYLTKVVTYFRLPKEELKKLPYRNSFKKNKRRLPPDLFVELTSWYLKASFTDLSIRIGARKHRLR